MILSVCKAGDKIILPRNVHKSAINALVPVSYTHLDVYKRQVVKLGLIAVSRDCFPIQLSEKRRAAIKAAYQGELYECPVTVENEKDMEKALEDVNKAECNALVVFLGNFGPETPETLIAERFDGPCMYVAAAEGDGDMINGRGDAYCGMLNCSYLVILPTEPFSVLQ